MPNHPPKRPRKSGLDENAYLDAERLFYATGDLRYLVIAIGKPRSSFFDTPYAIPDWALRASRDYAERIRNATAVQRRKISTPSIDPIPSNEVKSNFIKTMEFLLDGDLDEHGNRVDITLSEAARRAKVNDPEIVRQFRRFLERELVPEPGEDGEGPLSRRIEERALTRVAKRREKR